MAATTLVITLPTVGSHSGRRRNMALARVRAVVKRVIEFVQWVLGTVPVVRSIITGLVRIELIDRSMAIAAQAMLALVPMLVVLAAFLPAELTALALDRFRDLTGLGEAGKRDGRDERGPRPGARPDRRDRPADHAVLRDELRPCRAADVRTHLGAAPHRRR